MKFEYECALSGVTKEGGEFEDSDGLDDLPVGWTRIQITRRQYNPKYVALQNLKRGTLQQMLAQMPVEMRKGQLPYLELQVEAGFYALEQDTPMYLSDVDDVVYFSDDIEVIDAVNKVREMLGLEVLPSSPEDLDPPNLDDDGDGDDDADDEDDDS